MVGQTIALRGLSRRAEVRLVSVLPHDFVGDHGVYVFNDSVVQGLGERPQHLYSVRFAARELWGAQAAATDSVYVDLWDDHLEAA